MIEFKTSIFKRTPLLFLLATLFACGGNPNVEEVSQTENSFELVLTDSLDYQLLGDPIFADVSSDGSQVLIYDYASSELITLDENGNLLGKFSKTEDTPDAYGFMMELPGFLGNDRVVVSGLRGIFIYNLEGNLISKIDHPEDLGGAIFMPITGKSIESISLDGNEFLIAKSVRSRNTFPGEQAFYDRYRAIEWIDIKTGKSKDIIPFEEGSIFKNGKGYIESDYTPAYEWISNRLYVSLGGEPKLRVYTLTTDEPLLDTTINLSIPDFRELPIRERNEFAEGSLTVDGSTPAIRNIHQVGNFILVHYYAGMDPEKTKEAEELWMSGNEEEAGQLFEKLEKEVRKGFLIFDLKTLKQLGDITFPSGVETGGFLAAGDFLWFQKAPSEEIEEDFVRIYKFKLNQP
ncbi:hypothetical protein E4S40_11880 [Algoriphagus kandeliae]|uniref:DUF4221 domain-containing protein n=1 Tax=Algoriphagus kandeliae TaxID=2562278 RepID=A0A4Y9QPY0_9BACT|nr:hypothetical protein [Algoriphagus kandeliae]TFV94701.1 hypothetical protein E4S40_11880 [Algoriphagus kandeliae]